MITLLLMTKKGWSCLDHLVQNNLTKSISMVIVGRDKNQTDYAEEILDLARQNAIPCKERNNLTMIDTDYAIAISWRWLLKDYRGQLIVLHDSLLPAYRGFAPLVNQLIEGEKEIGVTAIIAEESYDMGPVLDQRRIEIHYPKKIADVIDEILPLYKQITVRLIQTITQGGSILSQPQDNKLATYSLWRDKEDYVIRWNWDADKIQRFVDAVGPPYDGASSRIGGRDAVITQVSAKEDVSIVNRDVGKVIFMNQTKPVVVCGKGLLQIEDGYFKDDGSNLLPLVKFRSRFI